MSRLFVAWSVVVLASLWNHQKLGQGHRNVRFYVSIHRTKYGLIYNRPVFLEHPISLLLLYIVYMCRLVDSAYLGSIF